MPSFLEKKLKAEYGTNSKIPFAIMNKMGVMRGSKETELGREMDAKHQQDLHDAVKKRLTIKYGKS